jgi:CRP/FNR family transcriptional regulator
MYTLHAAPSLSLVQTIANMAAQQPCGEPSRDASARTPCHFRTRILGPSVEDGNANEVDSLMFGRRKVRAGCTLFRQGQPFRYLYEVRSGNLKSSMTTADGRGRVSAFHMSDELIGLDGVAEGQHACSVTALEDSDVYAISYALLSEMAGGNAMLQRALMQYMSREIVRELQLLVLLGNMSAEERVAAFLLSMSQRLAVRGYSACDFHMRMTRADIGSYLGLTLETVSRALSAFQRLGLLEVDQRHILIIDLIGLARTGAMQTSPAKQA